MSITYKLRRIFSWVSIGVTVAAWGFSGSAGNGQTHFVPPTATRCRLVPRLLHLLTQKRQRANSLVRLNSYQPSVAPSAGEIYRMNADGTSQTRLTNNSTPEREPTWSPNNTKIAFSSFRNGRDSIYVINIDGTNEVEVTTDAASNDYPTWSRDGTRVIYSSNAAGNYQLYVINIDGTNRVRLTNNLFADFQPDW